MSWVCDFSKDAEADLTVLPNAIQKRVARVIAQMASDPFQGNVKSLQGDEWKGIFRNRIGDYRLLFTVDHDKNMVHVVRILRRSGRTYR